ncbi:hypothetical protein J2T13_002468 [Paenibacillus sp. DS2015]|uniref:hypothetical protein n=1 Tax=Paenibacillus sp. DS2015 TaxID=3373917 RepID=UPI003D21A395
MKQMLGIGIIVVVVIIGLYIMMSYNRLVSMRTGITDQQSPTEKFNRYAEIENTLYRINVQAEDYPELEALLEIEESKKADVNLKKILRGNCVRKKTEEQ